MVGFLIVLVALATVSVTGAETFNRSGFVITDFDGDVDVARDVLIQPNGKMVVAGWAHDSMPGSSGPDDDVALARYLPSGQLDRDFSGDGKVRTDLEGDLDAAYAIARQDDGKLVVAGTTGTQEGPEGDDFLLIRYRRDGSLDRSFGANGFVTTAFQALPLADIAYDVAIQRNGKIVAVGRSMIHDGICCSRRDMTVARYLPDGALDPGFSDDGLVVTDFEDSAYDEARAVVLQPDGRIVVGGMTDSSPDFALVRYRRNGELDDSFSADGKVTTSFGTEDDPRFCSSSGTNIIDDLAVQPDGRIVAVGLSGQCQGGGFAATRYRPNGSLDKTFGRGGRSVILSDRKPALGWAFGVHLKRNGAIFVGGEATGVDSEPYEPDVDYAVARLRPSGRLDRRFSRDGIKAIDLGDDHESAFGMAKRGKRAVVVGTTVGRPSMSSDWGVASFRVR